MKSTRLFAGLLGLGAGALAASAAEEMIPVAFSTQWMNPSADPRKDFYEYANGGWLKATEIPADKSRWGAFDALGENNWRRIRGILEDAAAKSGPAGSVGQQVGDFYASAMDEATIDAAGLKPLQPELARIEAIASLDDLARYVAYAHAHIGGPLFGSYIYADQKDNSRVLFILTQGGLSLPSRDYYFEPQYAKFLAPFTEHVATMLTLAGAAPEAAQAGAARILALETEMARLAKTVAELRDPLANYHRLSRAEAAAKMPGFPLAAYLDAAGLPAAETHLNVAQPDYFTGLGTLLKTRPLAEWKTYLRWQALRAAAPYLAKEFNAENFRFAGTVLNGTPTQEPRWQRAARVLDGQIGFAVSRIYVEKYFPPAVKARLEEMIQNMRDVLHDRIVALDWMSEPTKQKALEKLRTFRVVVGYPEKWRDYTGLEIRRDDYFGNVMRGAAFETKRQFAKLGQPFDRTEWLRTPQQVNAYYQPSAGQLVFLAGILQPPYFDPELDDAVNYGGIVAVIGHEISQGFDDKVRLYDAQGNLADWWTAEDAAKFKERSLRLVQQFNGYFALPGLAINGQQTLGENIGDLGGVSIAYEAFQRSLRNKRVGLIDGLTPEQRFFVAWAQVWRTKYRDDALKRYVATDVHSPGPFRAVGPLVNLQEFFAAFGIKEGDPMWRKPEDRAKIW